MKYCFRQYTFYWLLGLIVYHPAGCGGLSALCICLSVCLSVDLCSLGAIKVLRNAIFREIGPQPTPS